jgi:predicted RND superfamily exporter protein
LYSVSNPVADILFLTTAVMAWYASKVELSYDFIRAIPADDPQYRGISGLQKTVREDGNLLVVGIQSDKLFQKDLFNAYSDMHQQMKTSFGVEDVLSICSAIDLIKDSQTLKLKSRIIFPAAIQTQAELTAIEMNS